MTKILVDRETLVQVLDALEPCLEMVDGSIDVDVMNAMAQLHTLLDAPSEPEPFEKYLKEGETPIQRLEREIKDGRALMTIYGKALTQIQELQQQQDTPVAFYEIAHDEYGDVEYEFSVYPRPGFKPLYAQSKAKEKL